MNAPKPRRLTFWRVIGIAVALLLIAALPAGMKFYQSKVRRGAAVYRVMCANCHGVTAQGGRGGPDLTVGLTHGDQPWDLFRNISSGIPGTGMAPQRLPRLDVLAVVAYVRTLRRGLESHAQGNAQAGAQVFVEKGCDGCHQVAGKGQSVGPDLSRIGAARPVAYLAEKVRNPDRQITNGYETATVVQKDGTRVTGICVNEDTFSIQLRDLAGEYHSFWKDRIREVIHESKSLMPAYDQETLNDKELQDLVAYLISLKGR